MSLDYLDVIHQNCKGTTPISESKHLGKRKITDTSIIKISSESYHQKRQKLVQEEVQKINI